MCLINVACCKCHVLIVLVHGPDAHKVPFKGLVVLLSLTLRDAPHASDFDRYGFAIRSNVIQVFLHVGKSYYGDVVASVRVVMYVLDFL